MQLFLTRDYQTLEISVDKGQQIRLNCSRLFGNDTGNITYIDYSWFVNGTKFSTDEEVVVSPYSDTQYECVAYTLYAEVYALRANASINITLRGNIFEL